MSALLEVKNLKKYFKTPRGMLHAVDDVSFDLNSGKTLGVVGESGCGKSTLGRVLINLLEATDGEIFFEGNNVIGMKKKQIKDLRQYMQIIFQDPYSSLDPRMSVSEIIAEPLRIYEVCKSNDELKKRVQELMKIVGLTERLANAYPHELDGGRRQRIGIARALALNPKFIVCDEPVSALDVSIQAQILNLMQDLQKERGLTYLFITHNLSVVKHISDDIMVMYLGNMVEKCNTKALFKRNFHPYTKALLSAIPIPQIGIEKRRILLEGEISSPINPKPGCRFASRCIYAKERCNSEQPVLREILADHFVACHYVESINIL
ncbi:ABC transporter ATP-binding protein [Fusibacter ferrireducens]|uniref:ATP-binding cassette domain-containing protein n=1 Tax=Fusibacter ferrireducens TaxID=2785058 RepID=A0ABR9ZNZ2_9FIRM|nr:oligopeptide/dipeptide ABC transporter ATP-binding protein [Fusibacter ferrireducens]MBF4692188.1 ATP-binding cassette domain-containing protein [Fusibacter ferrireducens]